MTKCEFAIPKEWEEYPERYLHEGGMDLIDSLLGIKGLAELRRSEVREKLQEAIMHKTTYVLIRLTDGKRVDVYDSLDKASWELSECDLDEKWLLITHLDRDRPNAMICAGSLFDVCQTCFYTEGIIRQHPEYAKREAKR